MGLPEKSQNSFVQHQKHAITFRLLSLEFAWRHVIQKDAYAEKSKKLF